MGRGKPQTVSIVKLNGYGVLLTGELDGALAKAEGFRDSRRHCRVMWNRLERRDGRIGPGTDPDEGDSGRGLDGPPAVGAALPCASVL